MASIKRAGDLYDRPNLPYADATTIIEIKRAAGGYAPDPAAEAEGDPQVLARVDHGRWIGDCDLWDATAGWTCTNAQAIDPADERFFCIACNNTQVEGRWRPVTWPPDPAVVEEPLEELPAPEQNWTPEDEA